jgi:predicted nucleotidyltransferase
VTPPPLRLRVLLERLREAEVDFVLVGGLAVNAWGYLRATRDVDLVPDPAPENLARLDSLLVELGGKVEVGDRLLGSDAIKTFLRTGDRTLVLTDLGRVDVLQGLPQVPGFAALDERASEVEIDGLIVKVCALDDLLAMKRASDRPRDRDDLEALEASREGREPGAG